MVRSPQRENFPRGGKEEIKDLSSKGRMRGQEVMYETEIRGRCWEIVVARHLMTPSVLYSFE